MARYGATPLATGRWYHVAGVYNASARTLDLFLNGSLDNGFSLGEITPEQLSSRQTVYVGRRSDRTGYEFAGLIDDVRIYSRALSQTEIAADMRGASPADLVDPVRSQSTSSREDAVPTSKGPSPPCAIHSDREDAFLPMIAAVAGVLIAVSSLALLSATTVLPSVLSLAGGLLIVACRFMTLPPLAWFTIPLAALSGGAAIIASRSAS
jgi:hypothetical protein